ncbi:MAG: Hsp70 family protein [Planctomycetaceae bacterium]
MSQGSEFVVGIDLGTTNSVVAYAPLSADEPVVSLLPIPQFVAPDTVEERTYLPSFLYLPTTGEGPFELPWGETSDGVCGEYARQKSAEVPDRTVGAAKSWLCHTRVDRHQPILPWNADSEVPKVSPVEASRRYLKHLIQAWEHAHPEAPLSAQRVVLTVPASFDASARELTREAAVQAGLPENFVLIEEPQAAVYSWLAQMGEQWRKSLHVGDTLLVVDVGGGTTDLTLVSVTDEDGELALKRVAVGNHLLVGGDNMDLALAHYVAGLFAEKGTKLDPWQSVSLWHSCRVAKETLLAEDGPAKHKISILGRGRKLIGGTVSVELEREKARDILLQGFFPDSNLTDRPAKRRGSGFQELGLPYEADPGITKHIASFLAQHGESEDQPVQPTDVMVNGGVFKSAAVGEQLLNVLGSWFPDAPPKTLQGERDLDHAVARGAAYYGWSKVHGGVRIRGGTARSYYVGIESAGLAIPGIPRPLRALCVVPRGMEEGTEADVPSDEIGLIVGEPAHFRFFSSSIRKDDQPGMQIDSWEEEEIVETDSLEATLPAEAGDEGHYMPVKFRSRITELGMFELWCVSTRTDQRWKLEFNVREDDE